MLNALVVDSRVKHPCCSARFHSVPLFRLPPSEDNQSTPLFTMVYFESPSSHRCTRLSSTEKTLKGLHDAAEDATTGNVPSLLFSSWTFHLDLNEPKSRKMPGRRNGVCYLWHIPLTCLALPRLRLSLRAIVKQSTLFIPTYVIGIELLIQHLVKVPPRSHWWSDTAREVNKDMLDYLFYNSFGILPEGSGMPVPAVCAFVSDACRIVSWESRAVARSMITLREGWRFHAITIEEVALLISIKVWTLLASSVLSRPCVVLLRENPPFPWKHFASTTLA